MQIILCVYLSATKLLSPLTFFIHTLIFNLKSLSTTNVQPNIQEQVEQALG